MASTSPNWKRNTILFLISQSVTLFGSTLVQMAIVWYVTLDTSSGAWVAAFTVCSYLPQFLVSFVGGVFADRYDKKALIIVSDAFIAVVTLILMLVMPYISDNPALLTAILAVSVLRSIAAGIQSPAVNAAIPSLVPTEHLMRYNGINATMQSIVQFASPAAAGAILTVSTLRNALAIDVITAVVGIGMLLAVIIPASRLNADDNAAKPDVFADMKGGLVYAKRDGFIGKLLIVYGLFIFLSVPAGFLAQLLVSRVFGDSYWYLSAMELTGFAGMAIGGIVMGAWGGFKSRVKTLLTGLMAFGILAIGMGVAKNFILYLSIMFVYGVALTVVQTAITTLIQEKSQPEMQGRVFGLMGSMYSGFLPVGMAIFGPLADKMPLQWLMILSGAALMAICLGLRIDKPFNQKESQKISSKT